MCKWATILLGGRQNERLIWLIKWINQTCSSRDVIFLFLFSAEGEGSGVDFDLTRSRALTVE